MYLFWVYCVLSVYTNGIASAASISAGQSLNLEINDAVFGGENDLCIPECDSKIFCEGEILHDIQMARIYPDSKTFVDLKLLYPEDVIIDRYLQLKNETPNPNVENLKSFIAQNFAEDPQDQWDPPDFRTMPSIVTRIEDTMFQKWILNLNHIWKELGMKVNDDVKQNPELHSILYMPNGFIKAGGRFREMYYWDTYWIVRGLLLCDMYETSRGILENFIWLIRTYGHIPNGSRKYYLQRSQPPLLIQMAGTYQSVTEDHDFIRDNLKYFDQEFQWWYNNRMVDVEKNGRTYRMARYIAPSCSPRPESYYEDFLLSTNLASKEEIHQLYTNLKTAAESGWDFSTRHWRISENSDLGSLLDLDTPNFIFVDLNCILHANALVLSEWYKLFGNKDKSEYYKHIANDFMEAIENVLWNEKVGTWLDFDLVTKESRNSFYASNLTPLWTGSHQKTASVVANKSIEYLIKQRILNSDFTATYDGTPTSKVNSSQQWDFPNCWPPLQAIVIQGLERTHHPIAKYAAYRMAENWVKTMYKGFTDNGVMYEKYSADELGTTGAGGEYKPQTGFGWTNGFCMEIFNTWGKFLKSDELSV